MPRKRMTIKLFLSSFSMNTVNVVEFSNKILSLSSEKSLINRLSRILIGYPYNYLTPELWAGKCVYEGRNGYFSKRKKGWCSSLNNTKRKAPLFTLILNDLQDLMVEISTHFLKIFTSFKLQLP